MPRRPADPDAAQEKLISFGRRLRQLRTWRELSQTRLASRAGLSRDYIAKLEQGRMNPGLLSLLDIADAFDIPVSELLADGLPTSWARSTPNRGPAR